MGEPGRDNFGHGGCTPFAQGYAGTMNRLWFGLFGAALLLGCPPGGTSGSAPDAGASQLGCKEVLQCSAACSAADDGGCTDGCVARATPSAKSQLSAIVQCDQTNGCNSDQTCLESACAAELAACVSFVPPSGDGGGVDDFPKKYVGTVTDNLNLGGMLVDSTGNAVFVRDDQADPRGQSGMFAFYRLESITYVSKASGSTGPCSYSANETVTFTNPSPFQNLVAIKKQPNGQGAYEYDITTTLSQKRAQALTTTCTPGGTSTSDFNAENNVAAGVPAPTTTDKLVLKAKAQGSTRWSWDLKGTN